MPLVKRVIITLTPGLTTLDAEGVYLVGKIFLNEIIGNSEIVGVRRSYNGGRPDCRFFNCPKPCDRKKTKTAFLLEKKRRSMVQQN